VFHFLELAGRPGHQGLFPIQGLPLSGVTSDVEATITGEFSTVRFEFRSPEGAVLEKFRLHREPGSDHYYGQVQVPVAAFQVRAAGLDMLGQRYELLLPEVIRPQTFALYARGLGDLHPGQATTWSVEVKNFGPGATFRLAARDTHQFIRGVSPESFFLETGETVQIQIMLDVPADTTVHSDDIGLTVYAGSDPGRSNFARVKALVLPLEHGAED
jgi:hypothetical protein